MAIIKYFVALAAVLLMVMLGQYDLSAGRIQVPAYQAHTISGLAGLGWPEARATWCVWHNTGADVAAYAASGPGEAVKDCIEGKGRENSANETVATLLLQRYVLLDVLFVISYLALVLLVLGSLRRKFINPQVEPTPIQQGLLVATKFRWWLIALIGTAELAEAIVHWRFSNSTAMPEQVWVTVLSVASTTKWIAVGLAILMTIAVVGYVVRMYQFTAADWEMIKRLRLQIVVAVGFSALLTGFGMDQMQDALLGIADNLAPLIATPLAVVVLSIVLWRSVHRIPRFAAQPHSAATPGTVMALAVLSFALAWAVYTMSGGKNLFGLSVVLGVLVIFSWLGGAAPWHAVNVETGLMSSTKVDRTTRKQRDASRMRGDRWARLLATFPVLLLATFMIRAAAAPALLGPERGRADFLAAFGFGLGVLALWMPHLLERLDKSGWKWARLKDNRLYWASTIVCGANVLLVWLPWTRFVVPVFIGPVATVTLFIAAATIVGNELQRWSLTTVPITAFQVLRLKHTPVVTILLAWLVIGTMLETGGHQVRTLPSKPPQSIDLTAAFDKWATDNCAVGGDRSNEAANLVVIATAGGGIRAAYWTAGTLHALFPPGATKNCDRPVFAASGVSGGSLGIMSWLSEAPTGAATSYRDVLGVDHLSATMSWMMNADVVRSFIGFPQLDRAAVLEQSWERTQPALGEPFYAMWPSADTSVPLVLLNGTVVESGCRALTAPVELGAFDRPGGPLACRGRPEDPVPNSKPLTAPALLDLHEDYTRCNDIKRSTAALLSARFPYVTPAGRLTGCTTENSAIHIVDGGYVDASASLTAHDLYQTLKPRIDCHNEAFEGRTSKSCADLLDRKPVPSRRITPVLVQIDNGYDSIASAAEATRPREILVPLLGSTAALTAADSSARQRAYAAFGCPQYVRIANVPKPGTQAPLGWTLSRSAAAELDHQLSDVLGPDPSLARQLEKAVKHCQTSR